MSQKYANRQAFDVYTHYIAVKQHFTIERYDFHKYDGGVKISMDAFTGRQDLFHFHKLSKEVDWKNIILSNLVKNKNAWIGDIADQEGTDCYNAWKKNTDALSYQFGLELSKLDDTFKNNFIVEDGQHPYLLTLLLRKQITLETFTILSHIANIYEYWGDKVVDKYVACDIFNTSRKYKPFLVYDEKKFRKVVEDKFFRYK